MKKDKKDTYHPSMVVKDYFVGFIGGAAAGFSLLVCNSLIILWQRKDFNGFSLYFLVYLVSIALLFFFGVWCVKRLTAK